MSLYALWSIGEPMEFDFDGSLPSRRESLMKGTWLLNTDLRWTEASIMLIGAGRVSNDEYMRMRYLKGIRLERIRVTWSKQPYPYSMVRRQLKVKA